MWQRTLKKIRTLNNFSKSAIFSEFVVTHLEKLCNPFKRVPKRFHNVFQFIIKTYVVNEIFMNILLLTEIAILS